ncbi:MAG: histidine phosphatase family protein [Candidatus Gracilibacteria bacterium]
MVIYLIRHAESSENAQAISYSGSSDPTLSELGQQEAKKLAEYFSNEYPYLILSSEKTRAFATARYLADKFSKQVQKTPLLNEIDFGIFEGLTAGQVKEKFPEEYAMRLRDKLNYRIPEGENYLDVYARQKKLIRKLNHQENFNKTIFLFSHAGYIKVFIACVLGDLSIIERNDFIGNCAVTKITLDEDSGKPCPIFVNKNFI